MDISKLCSPALIYFIIAILYLIINSFSNFNMMFFIINLIIIIIWCWLLNFLCSIGYSIISWIMIIIPFFFYLSKVINNYYIE